MSQSISATDRPIRFIAVHGGVVTTSGVTRVGETTYSETLIADNDENALLGAIEIAGVSVPDLPDVGEELTAGDIYNHAGQLLMVRQSHTRTEHNPADVPALFIVYRENQTGALEWVEREQVYVGTERVYNDVTYRCIQAHVTEFAPDLVPALWRVALAAGDYPAWVPPTGAHDAYGLDTPENPVRVTHNGKNWRSTVNNNVWEPAIFGWELI